MNSATRGQILNEALSISNNANILRKNINRTVLPPAVEKESSKLCSLTLAWQPL